MLHTRQRKFIITEERAILLHSRVDLSTMSAGERDQRFHRETSTLNSAASVRHSYMPPGKQKGPTRSLVLMASTTDGTLGDAVFVDEVGVRCSSLEGVTRLPRATPRVPLPCAYLTNNTPTYINIRSQCVRLGLSVRSPLPRKVLDGRRASSSILICLVVKHVHVLSVITLCG